MEITRDSLTYVLLPVFLRLVLYFKLKNKDQTGGDVPADTSSNYRTASVYLEHILHFMGAAKIVRAFLLDDGGMQLFNHN
jgi:hypothetical protein